MIAQIQGAYMKLGSQVATDSLPVAGRAQQPVKQHERWVSSLAKFSMCQGDHDEGSTGFRRVPLARPTEESVMRGTRKLEKLA